jgi:hypothetical protein
LNAFNLTIKVLLSRHFCPVPGEGECDRLEKISWTDQLGGRLAQVALDVELTQLEKLEVTFENYLDFWIGFECLLPLSGYECCFRLSCLLLWLHELGRCQLLFATHFRQF